MSAPFHGEPPWRSVRQLGVSLVAAAGRAIHVDDDKGPATAPQGSPMGDWLRLKQRRYGPFLDQGSAGNKRLVVALGLIVGVLAVLGLPELLKASLLGNDIEIPLRAAERWSTGGQPYPPSAMLVTDGPDLPFLYPPFVLPLIAPFSHLPHGLVSAVWIGLTILAAVWACRRLGMPWVAVPFVLAWPPFFEGIILGNVQIMGFAAFVALLYIPGAVAPIQKTLSRTGNLANGLQAAGVGVLKVSQLVPVLFLARRSFTAAVFALMAIALMALVMLPFTGVAIYGDWLAQLSRANDPSWRMGGVPLSRLLGLPDLPFELAGLAIILAVRGRDAAAWLGIAMIVMAPSIHDYGFLFIIPGLMTLRRDLAIPLAAFFLGYYHTYAWWMCVLIVSYLLIASQRWPWLRAPARHDDAGHRSSAAA
jgi:hypothetical protein